MPPLASDGAMAVEAAAAVLASMRLSPSWSPGVGAYRLECRLCGEDGGHSPSCGVPAAEAWLERYQAGDGYEGLLDDARAVMAWLAGNGTEEYPGDGYGITCRICGRETDGRYLKGRGSEGHEIGCPLPELRSWVATNGRE